MGINLRDRSGSLPATGRAANMFTMSLAEQYLRLYDEQLRTDAETPSALSVEHLGTLRLISFADGRGFITYPPPGPDDLPLAELVPEALEYFRAQPSITHVEFKTRGHDHAPGLHEALLARGFAAQPTESIMIGPLQALHSSAEPPAGVTLRRVSNPPEVRHMCDMVDTAFGEGAGESGAAALLGRLERKDGMELWVAEIGGQMVGAGRLEPVAGTDFVGLWGGAVLPEFRGRGIYRALTSVRAESGLAAGKKYVHSDSTEYSRPILERAGLLKVSTTTPYEWKRPGTSTDS